MKKIGLFGGTFDPPHFAHFAAAQIALEFLNLDEIWFIPSSNPPHKSKERITTFNIRKEMLRELIKSNNKFKLKLFESDENKIHYTIDTITQLKSKFPFTEFYFIVGSDSFSSFHSWRSPAKILQLVKIVVFKRPGSPIHRKSFDKINMIELPTLPLNISSTQIRNRIKRNLPVEPYLIGSSLEIINRYNLYRD